MKTRAGYPETQNANCKPSNLTRAMKSCKVAFQTPAWTKCAAHVALTPFLLDCMHNLCEFEGPTHALCDSLQAFGAACQARGLKPPIWRNSSFCRECPPWLSQMVFPNPVSVCRSLNAVLLSSDF